MSVPSVAAVALPPPSTLQAHVGRIGVGAASPLSPPAGPTELLEAVGSWSPSRAPRPGSQAEVASRVGIALDPALLLLVLRAELRDTQAASSRARIRDGAARAELAHTQRQEALAQAERAARRAGRLLHRAPRWVKKLVSGVIAAVGVIASVYTGGASMALAIAGATLLLAGDAIARGLAKAGLGPKAVGWVRVGLELAGTVLMSASGVGAAQALPRVLEATDTACEVVAAASRVAEGSQQVARASLVAQRDRARIAADAAGDAFEEARETVEQEVRRLGDVMHRYARVARQLARISASADDARMAAIGRRA